MLRRFSLGKGPGRDPLMVQEKAVHGGNGLQRPAPVGSHHSRSGLVTKQGGVPVQSWGVSTLRAFRLGGPVELARLLDYIPDSNGTM